jgi:hypothetical protein
MTISGAPLRKTLTLLLSSERTVVARLRRELNGIVCKILPYFYLMISWTEIPAVIKYSIRPSSVQLPLDSKIPVTGFFSILALQFQRTPCTNKSALAY